MASSLETLTVRQTREGELDLGTTLGELAGERT
jgi:hypothetical protein